MPLFSFWLTLEVLAFIISVCGNSIVIFVMTRERRLRKKACLYIVSIAIADLLSSAFIVPTLIFITRIILKPEYGIPRTFCLWITSIYLVLTTASIFQLVFVAIDRYWAICRPISYHKRTTKFTKSIIVICWVIGLIIGSNPLFTNLTGNACNLHTVYNTILTSLAGISTVIITVLYLLMYRALKEQVKFIILIVRIIFHLFLQARKFAKPPESPNSPAIERSEIKFAKTMLLIIGSVLICWTPLGIYCIVEKYIPDPTDPHDQAVRGIIVNLCYCAVHFNFAIDPIIYAYRVKDIREAVHKLFRCKYEAGAVNDSSHDGVPNSL